jgi:acetyltransferase-like isoleucine patch superfamily enzyme
MKNLKTQISKHRLSDVKTSKIGSGTQIWQYSVVLEGAEIGENCNLNCHTFIENDVKIGNYVTLKCGVFLWNGTIIEDNVFIGPNVTFTNDKYPRSKKYLEKPQKIVIRNNASIGANSTILGGVEIGAYALIAAGSLVTRSVPAYALVKGSPAEVFGWVDEKGNKLKSVGDKFLSEDGEVFKLINNSLIKI